MGVEKMTGDFEFSVLQAAMQADPYPFYAALRRGPVLPFDPVSGCYLASRASEISAVLQHPAARVRPLQQPVPALLQGQRCGDVFATLLRMTDGVKQQHYKAILQRQLAQLEPAQVSQFCAEVLAASGLSAHSPDMRFEQIRQHAPAVTPEALNQWLFQTPVRVMAQLLGMLPDAAAATALAIADFVRCLPATATEPDIQAANAAVTVLMHSLQQCLADPASWSAILAQQFGVDAGAMAAANLLGLLSQSYEATAGLIGNSLIRCLLTPELAPQNSQQAQQFVREVSRFDPAVQNTRRFMAEAVEIDGQQLPAGATVLLLLASAGRDGQIWQAPDQFQPYQRVDQAPLLSFSQGAHQCPGQALAENIAATVLLLLWPLLKDAPAGAWRWHYQPSVNGRLPVFHLQQGAA